MSEGCRRCTVRVRQAYREIAAVHGEGRWCPFYDHASACPECEAALADSVAAIGARDACPGQRECGFDPGDDDPDGS